MYFYPGLRQGRALAVILTNDDAKIQTTNIDTKKSKNCNN
jgi:hypothetical protein